jgi:uncharacterized protein YjbI with pentapeptide repeats
MQVFFQWRLYVQEISANCWATPSPNRAAGKAQCVSGPCRSGGEMRLVQTRGGVMANEAHLKLLKETIEKQNIAIWNEWRQENPAVRPDLSGLDLRRVNLHKAALQGVIFTEANLRGTDLSEADLRGADLNRTNLRRTNFSAANLSEANLCGANLSEANLSEANLSEANFREALILGALLLGADLRRANLEDNVKDLMPSQIRTAKNWESAYFSKDILQSLGLPPDHNENLHNTSGEKAPEA